MAMRTGKRKTQWCKRGWLSAHYYKPGIVLVIVDMAESVC